MGLYETGLWAIDEGNLRRRVHSTLTAQPMAEMHTKPYHIYRLQVQRTVERREKEAESFT